MEARVLSLTGSAVGGIDYDGPKGDPGLFGPDSICWRVHGDFVPMLAGGISALLLQMLHPLALAGVWDHSNFRNDMIGRLRRTARFISATTFAPTAEALGEIERVRKIHLRIKGTASTGQAYSASDPDLLTWIHVAEVSSFLNAYQVYGVQRLSPQEIDGYFRETALVATKLGALRVPKSANEVARYLQRLRPELVADEKTASVLVSIKSAPAPHLFASLMRKPFIDAGFDLLPPFARQMYGQPSSAPTRRLDVVKLSSAVLRWSLVNGASGRSLRRMGSGTSPTR